MNDILIDFFQQNSERKMNESLLYCKSNYEKQKHYVSQVIDQPLDMYVEYVYLNYDKKMISSKDVIQFSNFDDCTINICSKLKSVNNPGMKFIDIGKLLLDDGKERKDGAYVKYGENHSKTATSLGLVFEFYNTYYLSCVGEVYLELEDGERKKLLDRLILRSTLISRMLQASQNGTVNMREFLYMLSDSTYLRRKSNMKKVVDYLYQSDEYKFDNFIEMIKF